MIKNRGTWLVISAIANESFIYKCFLSLAKSFSVFFLSGSSRGANPVT